MGNSAAFRNRWTDGLFVVTAILPDKKAITTESFSKDQEQEFLAFVERYNGKRNIYFHVNPVRQAMSKKALLADIKEVAWLHVDIDPREIDENATKEEKAEHLKTEQSRCLKLLTEKLPAGVPPPSVVVFSGGGYQGFWKLEIPIPIDGDLEKAEDAKRYNKQLEILLGGDNCSNIDRIMRLPGTTNIPDALKKKKGRERAETEVVSWDDLVYKIDEFTAAPLTQTPGERGFAGPKLDISGNIKRLSNIDELDEWDVDGRLKIIIVQGRHPIETKAKDDSRSAWLFDVVCNLKRKNVPDEVIFSIITDPQYGISESVLQLGSNAQRYALKQIQNADEEIISPWLRKLNEEFAVIGNMGGKCRVIEEIYDHVLDRARLTRLSFEDFRNRYMHIKVEAGTNAKGQAQFKKLGAWWLEHPTRRQFKTIVFAPGHDVKGAYNMWKGYACESKPGDCSLFLEHVKENICGGSDELYQYLFSWMARCVQSPAEPGQVAVVLRGPQGVGKSVFAKMFGSLFGWHFMHISNPNHLVGHFNYHLRDTVVLFADEAFYAGDNKHKSILKTLITEETITIEAKGIDAETAPNFVHLIMASNDDHVIPAGADERRFLMLDVGIRNKQDKVFFNAVEEQLKNGGREALLHDLLSHDLEGFEVRSAPQTKALQEQKMYSLKPEEEWWYTKLQDGVLIPTGEDPWPADVAKEELLSDYVKYTERFKVSKRSSSTSLGKFLSRVNPGVTGHQRIGAFMQDNGSGYSEAVKRRTYFYKMPNLELSRAAWETSFGPGDWPKEEE